jgi:GxxExxY protein
LKVYSFEPQRPQRARRKFKINAKGSLDVNNIDIDIEAIATDIVDTAVKVHKTLGPGLLESAYQACHAHEMRKRGHKVLTEVVVPIVYDGETIETAFRIDEFVDDLIIIENKTVESVLPIHQAQLLTYLKLKNCKLGFLINWNVKLIKDGIKRMANGLPDSPKIYRKP